MLPEEEQLYNFLTGEGKDSYNRTVKDLLNMNKFQLEVSHNFVQWIFPIDTESAYAYSVVLTDELIDLLRNNEVAKSNIRKMFEKMMNLYGYDVFGHILINTVSYNKMRWLEKNNHNFLRITRMLRCFHLLKMEDEEQMLFNEAMRLAENFDFLEESAKYWREAVKDAEPEPIVEEKKKKITTA